MEISIPIDHLSYSSMKLFCSNQQQFFKNYVLGIWDFKQSVTGFEGKAVHKILEHYYRTNNMEEAMRTGLRFIDSTKPDELDLGKTGSMEQVIREVTQAIKFYQEEMPPVGKVLAVEASVVTDKGFSDEILPVPVKAVTDLVTENDNKEIDIWDYKVVSAHTDKEDEEPTYILQALFNYLTIKAKFGKAPRKATFIEIKKSKNKDASPQLDFYQIEFAKYPHYQNYFYRLYTKVIKTLANPEHEWLPNFADYFSGKEAWKDFAAETINFEQLPKVSHKTNYRQDIRQVNYVESELSTNQVLTEEDKIRVKLQEFGIAVSMKDTHKGLNVTLYTMTPSRGVRMSAFSKLAPDLSLALEAKSVRVLAPIPGTGLVGAEVSNKTQGIAKWENKLLVKDSLKLPVGVDVYGANHSIDLTKAPHILIGGATGSGKSVFMNTVIHTLSRQNNADRLRLVLIDPKRTEFVEFEDLPHLLSPVITEAEDADLTLKWAVEEMENRYIKLRSQRVKTIQEYQKNATDMPYIVVVIDELADLMLNSITRNSIETSIVKLAQKARAAGIHLVCATQRPSVDVVTGLIKANFPTRIAFMVSTGTDSRVILDDLGAEDLIGNGDLLLMSPAVQGFQRLQGYLI